MNGNPVPGDLPTVPAEFSLNPAPTHLSVITVSIAPEDLNELLQLCLIRVGAELCREVQQISKKRIEPPLC